MRFGDPPFRVNQIGDSPGVLVLIGDGRAVELADFLLGVGDQRIGELVLLGEGPALRRRIEAAADDLGVLFLVILVKVPEPGPFGGSAGGVGFGKEPQHDILPSKILQLHLAAEGVVGREVRSDIARFQHFGSTLF